MKLTTDAIKPFLSSKFNTPPNQIKRGRKYKDSNGQVIREFNVGSKLVSVTSSPDDSEVLSVTEMGMMDNSPTPNPGVKNKFNNYYFAVAAQAHHDSLVNMMVVTLVINPKKYWDTEQCVYDQPLKIENDLAKFNIESPNESGDFDAFGQKDPLSVVQLLLNLGLEYNNNMAQWLTTQTGTMFYIKP